MNVSDLLQIPPWEWPDDAGTRILKCLTDRDGDLSERLEAAELAAELVVMDDELARAVLVIAASPHEPEGLRSSAVLSLGPVLETADAELADDDFDEPEDVPISLEMFRFLQESLHKLYLDPDIPRELKRRILETAVRAPQDWQVNEIKTAYASGEKDWMVTAVFAMRWVRGFDDSILEAMQSADLEIHGEAVNAAGGQELDAAWSHVAGLLQDVETPKPLLMAAIEAAVNIRPQEAVEVLAPLAESPDEEISAAVNDALSMASALAAEPEEDEHGSDWVN